MKQINIHLYTKLLSKRIQNLLNAFEFIAKQSGENFSIKTTNEINEKLILQNDFLIIPIDELEYKNIFEGGILNTAEELLHSSQIILLLEDIKESAIPSQYEKFPRFQTELYYGGQTENMDAANVQLITDITLYLQRTRSQLQNQSIFLAPSGTNITKEYLAIARELCHRNFILNPDTANFPLSQYLENPDSLFSILNNSLIAVHFINPEAVIGYPEKLSPAIQIVKLTAEYCHKYPQKSLKRIIYIPYAEHYGSEQINHAIEALKQDNYLLINGELIQNPIEKFKSIVVSATNTTKNNIVTDIPDRSTYLLSNLSTEIIQSDFSEQIVNEVNIISPSGNLNHMELLKQHQNYLIHCKGIIIYCDYNLAWITSKLNDIMKAPGWGRIKDFEFKIIVCKSHYKEIKTLADDTFTVIESQNISQLPNLINPSLNDS